ncbi:AraC family transcriptional regulator [Ructibacterium gallinarum]|nr:AraC family transcriptional regulator [Ructibacterium gallinarum]
MEPEVSKMKNSASIPVVNRGFRDLNPLIAGWEKCNPGYSYGPHVREYYLIHYVKKGKGVFYNAEGGFPVHAGEIFVIRPGEVTTYTADTQVPWEYIWVGFDGAMAGQLAKGNVPVQSCGGTCFEAILRAEERTARREEYIAGQLFLLMSELLEQQTPPPGYERQAADYICANYMRDITMEEIASMLGLSRRYLSRIFKRFSGMTMQEFLIRTRMEHAVRYLCQGKTVSEAAALAGYADVFHFSKMFRRRFGISPRQYAREHRKNPEPGIQI